MSRVPSRLRRFWRLETAATMVEYGIMVALVAAISIAVIKVIGTKVNTAFGSVNTNLP
ncbi:MAG: Flp family type IVb pilin [Gemmatimonadaceae bacterium]|jgi:pilus assembly protein Flp/PilA